MIKENENKSVFLFLLHAIRPFKMLIAGQFFVAILCAIDVSIRPYLIKLMLNRVAYFSPENGFFQLILLAIAYIGVGIILFCAFRLRDWVMLRMNPEMRKQLGLTMMQRLMTQSHHFYQHNFAGSLTNKISDVVVGIPAILKLCIDEFFCHMLAILVAIYTVWHVATFFAVALAIWVIIFFVVSAYWSAFGAVLSDITAEKTSILVGDMVDVLTNMMSVRLFGMHRLESERLSKLSDNYVAAARTRNWFYMKIYAFQGISFILFQIVCFWWLIKGLKEGIVTAGDFALILSINLAIVNCLWNISKDLRDFSESFGNVAQGLRILHQMVLVVDAPEAQPLRVSGGSIVFDHVVFNYQGAKTFFEDKSVTIFSGQKVGLVGYSGSGKSTFVNLILRLFDVQSGRILIDNQDIRMVTQRSLHDAIGMIPQDPVLFHRSIMENIRYGSLTASDQDVILAAKKAHAHDFIIAQPDGYNTLVGERGGRLSGGQRQRIAIARAILKNSPLLILDEATSQLDSETELFIQDSLWKLMQDKTTIVIAHRLPTLLRMDRILVFDQGLLVEDGTHNQLLAKNGLYARLWGAQIGGVLPDFESMIGVEE